MKRIPKILLSFLAVLLLLPCVAAFAAPQTGSVRITLHDLDTKQPVTGAVWRLYQVASLQGNAYVLTTAFAASGVDVQNLQSADAKQLAAYAAQLEGQEQSAGSGGSVQFSDLALGAYLLVQTGGQDAYSIAEPFLVCVPMTSADGSTLIYDIDASPKVSVKPAPDPTPSPTPTGPKLPQTGQLNWPIPVLAAAGMTIFIVGFLVYIKGKKHE